MNGSGGDRYTSRSLDSGVNAPPPPLGHHKSGSSRSATKSPAKNKMASPGAAAAQGGSSDFNDLPHFDVSPPSQLPPPPQLSQLLSASQLSARAAPSSPTDTERSGGQSDGLRL